MRLNYGFLVLGALTAIALPQLPKTAVLPSSLSTAWTTAALPDVPLGISAHGGAFWVCGANEMIARSTDGGRSWIVLHHKRGQMLFALVFGARDVITAYGTAGVRLQSRDAGATWHESWMTPARGLSQVQFANRAIGYAFGPAGFAMTHDGGRNWSFWNLTAKNEWNAVVGMAVEGQNDAMFLVGGNRLVITRDGGRSWQAMAFGGKAQWTGLGTVAGKYRLYGVWQGQPGAAATPSKSASAIAAVPWDDSDCTQQGCLVSGGWADRGGGHWSWPDDVAHPLTGRWAVVGDSACRVSDVLRCRLGRTPLAAPTPVSNRAGVVKRLCLHCPAPAYPRCLALRGCTGGVLLKVLIGDRGAVAAALVIGADGPELAQAARAGVLKWKFAPPSPSRSAQIVAIIRLDFQPPNSNLP